MDDHASDTHPGLRNGVPKTCSGASVRRACLHTLGCRLNQAETRLIEEQLLAAGYELVPFGEPADLGIIHTCVVTREAEAKSRKHIHRFKRANPDAITVVIGCYAQTASESAASLGADLVLGNDTKLELARHLEALAGTGAVVLSPQPRRETFSIPFLREGPVLAQRVNLKIQDGCDQMCTYCYIPFARGRSRSRLLEDAVAEAQSLVSRGARELVLAGVNIGDYRDGNAGLLDLIDRLDSLEPGLRIRISSIELGNIPEGVLARMANPNHALVPHLHIPLQSGSDEILNAMRRPYTAREYIDYLRRAAREVPGIGLGADVMVGFPGETRECFEDTRELIRQSPLDYLHVFSYSERSAVASARIPGKVEEPEKQRRSEELRLLGEAKKHAGQLRQLGASLSVLFEDKRGEYWVGHTENYYEMAVVSAENLRNVTLRARPVEIRDGMLFGALDL